MSPGSGLKPIKTVLTDWKKPLQLQLSLWSKQAGLWCQYSMNWSCDLPYVSIQMKVRDQLLMFPRHCLTVKETIHRLSVLLWVFFFGIQPALVWWWIFSLHIPQTTASHMLCLYCHMLYSMWALNRIMANPQLLFLELQFKWRKLLEMPLHMQRVYYNFLWMRGHTDACNRSLQLSRHHSPGDKPLNALRY